MNITPIVTIYGAFPVGRSAEATPPPDTAYTPTPTPTMPAARTDPPVESNAALAPSAEATTAAVARTNANVRSGPGLNYPVIYVVPAGTALDVRARTPAGDWLLLGSGGWIYADLVANTPDVPVTSWFPPPPAALPVVVSPVPAAAGIAYVTPMPPLPPAPVATAPPTVVVSEIIGGYNPSPFTCIDGCATPPNPACPIKGNVNSRGEKIYHMPNQRDYDRTDIKPEEGDAWFCTPQEAEAAGFRPAKR